MNKLRKTRDQRRLRRRIRVRARVIGSATKPRLSVFRSLGGMYVQIIDDSTGTTLVSVNSKKDIGDFDTGERTGKEAVAFALGKAIAKKASIAHITSVVFDRGGYTYHGRVKAVADGARDGGLIF